MQDAARLTVCVPNEAAREGLASLADRVRIVVWDGFADAPDGVADTEFLVGAYMGRPMPAESLARLHRLRVIQLLSAGVDLWRPLIPEGVLLCNGRGVHGGSTAELAVAGILMLLRRMPHFVRAQQEHAWSPETGESLDGKRLLVLGSGDIGNRVAAALEVFGAVTTRVARTARDGVHGIDELAGLLPSADIVLVSVPLTDQTRGLVDARMLAQLPDGAIVANIARGAIVDTDALADEVGSGRLRAFLDVTAPEPLPPEHRLWSAENVIITPHVGGGTRGWAGRGFALVRDQIERYLAGEELHNIVGGDY
jgi:phosphoglycerate dehydrogenase-like enzyme